MSVSQELQDTEVDHDLVMLIDSLLADRGREFDHDAGQIDLSLWRDLDEAGLSKLTGDGEFGSGASWREAAVLLRSAAAHAVAAPIAENDVLAGWLAGRAGLADTVQLRTSGILDERGVAHGVAWGRSAASAVLLRPAGPTWMVRDVPISEVDVVERTNLAGEPRDTLRMRASGECAEVDRRVASEWRLRGALARAVQISGALQHAVEIAVQYTTEREQFGRPIGSFQAVQNLTATMASETALVLAASDSAVLTAAEAEDWSDPQVEFDIAVAKSCASSAASVVTRNAHQILGALGTTAEHPLHTVTLPALSWASEFGTADDWNERIIRLVGGPEREASVWELITRTPTGSE